MINRRKFIRSAGSFIAGGALFSNRSIASFLSRPSYSPPGLQLFTLFNVMDDDVRGSLKKVAAIGFKEVESAFSKKGEYYGMSAKEFSAMLSDLGLSWKSHHVLGGPINIPPDKMPKGPDGKPISIPPMHQLRDNMQEIVDKAAASGVPFLVCATTPIDSMDEIKRSIATLNTTGEACKKAGITLCYHNHDAEFAAVDGEIPYQMFLSQLSPDIKMELDLCWATKAGVNIVELFKKHPGRFPLWHVKDLDKNRQGPAPVGAGVVDFATIFANAATAGLQHFFVEHDMPQDPYASITESYNYLTTTLKV